MTHVNCHAVTNAVTSREVLPLAHAGALVDPTRPVLSNRQSIRSSTRLIDRRNRATR